MPQVEHPIRDWIFFGGYCLIYMALVTRSGYPLVKQLKDKTAGYIILFALQFFVILCIFSGICLELIPFQAKGVMKYVLAVTVLVIATHEVFSRFAAILQTRRGPSGM